MTMVERVARAILFAQSKASVAAGASSFITVWENTPVHGQQNYRAAARAAIEAMREPGEALLAGAAATVVGSTGDGDDLTIGTDAAREAWQMTIRAALEEGL